MTNDDSFLHCHLTDIFSLFMRERKSSAVFVLFGGIMIMLLVIAYYASNTGNCVGKLGKR